MFFRFDDAKDEMLRTIAEDELRDTPFIVLANKQDLPGAMTPREIHDRLVDKLPRSRTWAVFGVSATYTDRKSTGLIEAFEWLTDAMVADQTGQEIRKWIPQLAEPEDNDDKNNTNKEIDAKNNPWSISSLMQSLKGMLYRVS